MIATAFSIETVLPGIPLEAIETAQTAALEQFRQYLAKMVQECDPNHKPMNGEQIESFAGELYTRYCACVGGKAHDGKPLPTWAEFSVDMNKIAQANAWRQVAQMALDKGAVLQVLPHLIIVDLYGDRESLRVIPDTPANEKVVRDFEEADRKYVHGGPDDPPDFTDFTAERGVPMFVTRQIALA